METNASTYYGRYSNFVSQTAQALSQRRFKNLSSSAYRLVFDSDLLLAFIGISLASRWHSLAFVGISLAFQLTASASQWHSLQLPISLAAQLVRHRPIAEPVISSPVSCHLANKHTRQPRRTRKEHRVGSQRCVISSGIFVS